MAVFYMDGFDHYATNDIAKVWNYGGTGSNILSTVPRRTGSKYLRIDNYTVSRPFPDYYTEVIIGFAIFQEDGLSDSTGFKVHIMDGSSTQLILFANSTGRLKVHRSHLWNDVSYFLGETAAMKFTADSWYYVEIKAKIHDTLGTIDVQINGVNELSLTGVDTKYTANTRTDGVKFEGASEHPACYDDIYFLNCSVSPNITFLGDSRVDVMYPTSDHSVAWTRSAGTANWQNVDDNDSGTGDIDDDTTYNYSSTATNEDVFDVEDPPVLVDEVVHALAVAWTAKKDDAGSRSVKCLIHSGAGTEYGTAVSLPGAGSDSYVQYQTVWNTNPWSTLAWNVDNVNEVNDINIGYNLDV